MLYCISDSIEREDELARSILAMRCGSPSHHRWVLTDLKCQLANSPGISTVKPTDASCSCMTHDGHKQQRFP